MEDRVGSNEDKGEINKSDKENETHLQLAAVNRALKETKEAIDTCNSGGKSMQ